MDTESKCPVAAGWEEGKEESFLTFWRWLIREMLSHIPNKIFPWWNLAWPKKVQTIIYEGEFGIKNRSF